MPATYNKFNNGVKHLIDGKISFSSDTFAVFLTNTAPVATNNLYGDISSNEVANGNGYVTGGEDLTITTSVSTNVGKATVSSDITWTASGALGPFRYIVVYDKTPVSPLKPLWNWYDYGSALTLQSGETFTVDFDQTNGLFYGS